MNIKILDSHLREFIHTKATPHELAKYLSLTSVSVERMEKLKNDTSYDIEVTTNRPDLMSVVGLAKEAAAALTQAGIHATWKGLKLSQPKKLPKEHATITIKNDDTLVKRVCGVIMDVTRKESPQFIKDRLEAAGIRSLNNIIDITNYVMLTVGHPTHVFDYDRLTSKKLIIRESKKGEKIVTLDGKTFILSGGDIVADNGNGDIVDLLGIMGTANSVVTNDTKRILFFLDNNDQHRIRKTSMGLHIRTEAAVLNEKGVDPELAMNALLYGIELYQQLADGKLLSNSIDIYPHKPKPHAVSVSEEKINKIIGIPVPLTTATTILESLGFQTSVQKNTITAVVPSYRSDDVQIEEDLVEEIARVYGYHNIPSLLPLFEKQESYHPEHDEFLWEMRVKNALKYWGFTEVYTYSMVSEQMLEVAPEHAVTIQNPLTDDMVYMRTTLIPSLLQVVKENSTHDTMHIFELANVYTVKQNDLPAERHTLAGVVKKHNLSFYEVKGVLEQLFDALGIANVIFKPTEKGGSGADIFMQKSSLGTIEILDTNLINFELDFATLIAHATLKKTYVPLAKYPPVVEDHAIIAPDNVATGDIIDLIKKQSPLIVDVSLLDKYEDSRTFHIVYQDKTKNLTNEEVSTIREKILTALKEKFNARLK